MSYFYVRGSSTGQAASASSSPGSANCLSLAGMAKSQQRRTPYHERTRICLDSPDDHSNRVHHHRKLMSPVNRRAPLAKEDHIMAIPAQPVPPLAEFYRLGMDASYHYADDSTSEWHLGDHCRARAMEFYHANPELQPRMREIAAQFLWSLELADRVG